jgi:hypothetical protein
MNSDRRKFNSAKHLPIPDQVIIQSFARLDRTALGVALGSVFGLVVFCATVVLLLKGGDEVGPNLSLLGQYFIGYKVSWTGSLIGLFYGFVSGFILGCFAAFLRNLVLDIYLRVIKLRTNLSAAQDLFD